MLNGEYNNRMYVCVFTSCCGTETLKALFQNEIIVVAMQYKQWAVRDRATVMTVA
jgi:hypothetical protein